MFPRLAEQYRSVVQDLVISLQALALSLQARGLAATCYTCGDGRDGQGASFVANLGENHMVRFLVSDFGISWVESRDGRELVKLERSRNCNVFPKCFNNRLQRPSDSSRQGAKRGPRETAAMQMGRFSLQQSLSRRQQPWRLPPGASWN